MGKVGNKNITIAISIFIVTIVLIYLTLGDVSLNAKKMPLKSYLDKLPGWQNIEDIPLDRSILEVLKLDDYVFKRYKKGGTIITLYVGYYYSNQKVGAAHDPLVCFPGQGWEITDRHKSELKWQSEKAYTLSYASMIGKLGQRRELITYWFQFYDQTSNNTLLQKIGLFKNNILRLGGDNAFCRITVSMEDKSDKKAVIISEDFMKSMYPQFLDFVLNG